MRLMPVMFEDHTLAGFRPLAWSVPVSELRCGILNPRERVERVFGQPPILLVRSFLEPLAAELGHATGPDTIEGALPGSLLESVVLVSPRLGADWERLEALQREAEHTSDGFCIVDGEGLLAAVVPRADLADWLGSWRAWRDQADASGAWRDPTTPVPRWEPPQTLPGREERPGWRRLWDLIPATAAAISDDLERIGEFLPARRIWGALPVEPEQAVWTSPVALQTAPQRGLGDLVTAGDPARVWLGPDCRLAAGVAIDAREGPVVLGAGVEVMPHSYLAGPLFVGSGSRIKAGATIYGETSLGAVNRVAGEIGESTFLDFVNKQHDGFIGHSYLGSWCNLGAMTTNSDLKNTYGTIRVDLGQGAEDTGLRFVGLLMGEHGKTAIGTLFNTGTTVGFASNVFGTGFPAKRLDSFTWGDGRSDDRHDPRRATETAATVMQRRGCRLTDGCRRIFEGLA
ncbi:hypothetical protein GF314_10750 [bacterium]|nr:hypothetical protein [bacterium]